MDKKHTYKISLCPNTVFEIGLRTKKDCWERNNSVKLKFQLNRLIMLGIPGNLQKIFILLVIHLSQRLIDHFIQMFAA